MIRLQKGRVGLEMEVGCLCGANCRIVGVRDQAHGRQLVRRLGWTFVGGKDLCPRCSFDEIEEETIQEETPESEEETIQEEAPRRRGRPKKEKA